MEKVWLNSYDTGVAETIDPDQFSSLIDIMENSFEKYTDKAAFINMDKSITYAELDTQSKAFAAYLQNTLNLKQGDTVALMMPNLLQYPIALFGVLRAGCVVANVNPLYTPRELKHQLNDSDAKAIVIVSNFAHTLESVYQETNIKHIILTQLGDQLGFVKKHLVNFVVKNIKKMVPDFNLPNTIPFNQILSEGLKLTYNRPNLNNQDLAFLQYTGGTTGVAKGAMLTHRNMLSNLLQANTWLQNTMQDGKEVVITALPMYHIFALLANCLNFFRYGATNVLITNPRDMPGFVKELSKYPFTVITGVNTLFNGLLNNDEFSKLNFSPLKLTLGGGMAVQKAVADKWHSITGTVLLEAYGLTECSPAVCINPISTPTYNGTIGLPISSTECRIVDEDGNILGVNEVGELLVKGPQVMKGYYNRQDATQEVLKDGWLYTGDIATIDENGFVKIVDRKKDMIITSGFNVYPNEIEDVAALHPMVLEAAAIGIPNEKCGEIVKLFVVKKDEALTEASLIAHCKENLTGYKVPKVIEFKDDLPKTNVGKILRRELRD